MIDSSVVPEARRRLLVDLPPAPTGEYVVYWMTSARRLTSNYALARAVELAATLGRPLVVLEALRVGYRWASDRHHAFVLQGMADNARFAAARGVLYHPYVEPSAGAGRGLLEELARRAAAVVTDDFPAFFLPRMLGAAAGRVGCRLEAVDSNGLLPVAAGDRLFATAHAFRRFLQANLKRHLLQPPPEDPLATISLPRLAALPEAIVARWPGADARLLAAEPAALAMLPIDHGVAAVAALPGGAGAAAAALERFVDERLARYAEERNHPDADAASGLSPYLHFGHLSAHDVLARIAEREGWSAETLASRGDGARHGWWGMTASAEAFLDQLVTWRELGLNFCARRPDDYDRFESLPEWSRATLAAHAGDARRWTYDRETLAAASTHDEIWNAAQRQLVGEGRIQNYLRMLWGKKVIEWSATPAEALARLVELNDRYALDGRDPNSYSGICWCFGRYDRPWGPRRPIFGTVRYMSSESTWRKLRLDRYLRRWSAPPSGGD